MCLLSPYIARAAALLDLGPALRTSFNSYHVLADPVSKYRHMGFGAPAYDWGRAGVSIQSVTPAQGHVADQ